MLWQSCGRCAGLAKEVLSSCGGCGGGWPIGWQGWCWWLAAAAVRRCSTQHSRSFYLRSWFLVRLLVYDPSLYTTEIVKSHKIIPSLSYEIYMVLNLRNVHDMSMYMYISHNFPLHSSQFTLVLSLSPPKQHIRR